MKTIYISAIFFFFASLLSAQTNTDKQKDEINKIKKNKNYIYGEATLPDQDEAMKLAKEILIKNINDWVAGEKKMKQSEAVVIRDIIENGENISLMRGNMFRAFVYVQKKNILPVEDTDKSVVLSRSTSENEEPVIVVSDIKKVEAKETEDATVSVPLIARADDTAEDILTRILTITEFGDIGPYFQQLKANHKIVYGKYATMTSPENCYMLIYNKEGKVVAILDKGHRKNLRTQEEDSLKNYSGCGALWFQFL